MSFPFSKELLVRSSVLFYACDRSLNRRFRTLLVMLRWEGWVGIGISIAEAYTNVLFFVVMGKEIADFRGRSRYYDNKIEQENTAS